MSKVYFVRHQAAGILFELPFAQSPTDEQLAACAARCFRVHGFGHPKTPTEPYWVRVEEFDVLGPDAIPSVPEITLSVASAAGATEFSVSGAGEVTPAGV